MKPKIQAVVAVGMQTLIILKIFVKPPLDMSSRLGKVGLRKLNMNMPMKLRRKVGWPDGKNGIKMS